MSRDIPPHAVAELDQFFAEAKEKYHELVEVLRDSTDKFGMYEAIALMTQSLDRSASRETLLSMVATGLWVEMQHGETKIDE